MKLCKASRLILVLLLGCANLLAQTYNGTNAPGAFQDFSINLGPGATNLSVVVNGSASSYSYLLLKKGATPSNNNYDFIALGNGQTNAMNLEAPEFTVTNYVVRVSTPATSATHSFTLTVATNVTNIRSAAAPATKSLVAMTDGILGSNGTNYFRVDVPTNLPPWRIVLYSTNNAVNPDLYVQTNVSPTSASFLKRSTAQNPDTLVFTNSEAAIGPYVIGVFQGAATNSFGYTLGIDFFNIVTLSWDPGTTHLGTQVYTNQSAAAGDYFFRVVAQNTALGAWRTALNVSSGEAHVYLQRGVLPSPSSATYKSERVGSDGFVVPASAFTAGEEWFIMVRANPGSQWTLVTGEPFVQDLGAVAAGASSGSGDVPMGAEGMRFFKTTVPLNTLAWRLWMNGLTNTIMVKKGGVPVTGAFDLSQNGQMLVVPSYLAGGQLYFVGVSGNPGATINLDSRQHSATDINFESMTSLSVTGFPYVTYRVQVPVDQLAWQASTLVTNGNPNVAVRRSFVPNEFNNDAYSEVPGTVTDSISLVPPTLSDGTFYVTVYGTNAYSCSLQSGTPVVTDIDFTSMTVNDDPNRAGWRYFRITDLNQQLGALGWDLFLQNFAPGTKIGLRRNAVPSSWNFRNNGNNGSLGSYDILSSADFLQHPAHQADVWYVGVFNPNTALGAFTLVSQPLTAQPMGFDGDSQPRNNIPTGKWQFFQFTVPPNTLGWDLRFSQVSSGSPRIVIRRDQLPTSLQTVTSLGAAWSPGNNFTFPSGNQWKADLDWTRRNLGADGATDETGRILETGAGQPLEPGTYYAGVIDQAGTNAMTYTLSSRGIGPGFALPITDLAYTNGTDNATLPGREVAYYRVQVPTNVPSWKIRLAATNGDALLIVLTNHVPNVDSGRGTYGKLMQKMDNEHYLLLPALGKTNVAGGVYYLAVVSEGMNPVGNNRIGSGSTTYTLTSVGPLPVTDLGTLSSVSGDITLPDSLEGGEVKAYTFNTSADSLAMEIRLENRVGNPVVVATPGTVLPDPGQSSAVVNADNYGNEGGGPGAAAPDLITCANCGASTYSLVVKARGSGLVYSNATYTLRLHSVSVDALAFDATDGTGTGMASVTNQPWGTFRYWRVTVPANAQGWDIRLKDVSGTGIPHMVVRRDLLPGQWVTSFTGQPGNSLSWPSGSQWSAHDDWTRRSSSADGLTNETGRLLEMGMGRPLEPGTYIVGVLNDTTIAITNGNTSYTIWSRGIGTGLTIPITDLDFKGGSATNTGLGPREAAYYRVQVPPGAPSWQVTLSTNAGEVMLLVLSNTVPNVDSGQFAVAGKFMHKTNSETYVLLPTNTPPQSTLPGGTYYLAVVGEGLNATNATRIGAGNSSFTIQSIGPMPVVDLGTVAPAVDLTNSVTNQDAGGTRGFQFSVPSGISSLEVHLDNRVGNPVMVVRLGAELPDPSVAYSGGPLDDYGSDGGYAVSSLVGTNAGAGTSLVTLPNPPAGIYSVVVKARSTSGIYSNANYTLRVTALTFTDLSFDGSGGGGCPPDGITVSNQAIGTWRYFRVQVPTNMLGWDVRVANVSSNSGPRLVVRRDLLPNSLQTAPWGLPGTSTNWPSTNQWAPFADWTSRQNSSANVAETYRILAMGANQPLEPGTYFVGVNNSGVTTNLSYTILSRGIGDGLCLPVTDLPYSGGSVTNSGLAPREAAYYRVVIPSNAPSLKIRVTSTAGEVMLVVLTNKIPCIDSGHSSVPGKFMQKAGNEHYILLPPPGQNFLTPGVLYLAVVSEGINPPSSNQTGAGNSSFVISCEGAVPIFNLGVAGATDLVRADTLQGGESKAYQFSVSQPMSFEVRLENRVGNPVMVMRNGPQLPYPGQSGASFGTDDYGNEAGQFASLVANNNIPMPSPTNGVYTIVVKARILSGAYPDANYTLRIRQVPVFDLNFSSDQNTNGRSNVATGLLADNQRAYYRVIVPATNNGVPVLGWRLDLSQSAGQAWVRARQNLLPDDAIAAQMPFTPATAVLAPPFLTNGTWYVEVRGSNSTAFTLVSQPVILDRPAWALPGTGQPSTTPGLVAPNFGDTGVDTNGVPASGDQGTDLAQGSYDYYEVNVPATNSGVMRVQLTAISGNPDLYVRTGFIPTITHRSDGQSGTLYDRSLASSVTEYGNFVPLIGRTEFELAPGPWYIAVRAAGNANARYRLRLSAGNIQDLSYATGSATGIVAGSDWFYYRVKFPEDSPTNWWVTFNQLSGDVVMYVRDTIPPGNGSSVSDIRDWSSDIKNTGPYPSFDAPGTYLISTPQLRPGSTYYLGFKANNDAMFTISNNIVGGKLPLFPTIDFYGGSVSNVLAPNSEVTYRIYTPRDATRWIHTATHVAGVKLYLQNGVLPPKNGSDNWQSTVANSSLNQYLISNWPWVANANYYLTITNTTASAQPYSFVMDGRNASTDDNDLDGMPDAWERQYFGSTTPTAAGDFDGDGVSNLNEYLEGTNPANALSFRPRVNVTATNGVVNVNPPATNYPYGASVTLTAMPNSGYSFLGWSVPAFGTNNPLPLVLTSNINIFAIFRAPGDDFAQRIPITGWSNTVTSVNTNASKEPGEPNHAGNAGGHSVWWTWTALSTGNVTLSTAGSSFNTLLAVYTGTAVTNLSMVATNDNDGTNLTSRVTFAATAGGAYAIAVDGASGASGNIILQVQQESQPVILGSATRLGDGSFQFTISAAPGYNYDIQASSNLTAWTTIATLPNPTGVIQFTDPNAAQFSRRMYRASRGVTAAPPWTLTSASRQSNQFSFSINGPTGQVVRVESSSNLANWGTLATLTNLTGSLQFTDPAASNFTRFYRTVSQ